uniref:Cytochrome P450 6PZ15 short isoform n=1 Tax=Maconellicoccus hirsutus TaxID=177089 RepID=A0AAT9UU18_MACHI
MDTIEILFCAIFLSIIYLYYRFKNNYTYFERNGIPYIKPVLFFGNVADWVFMKKPLPVVHFELYKKLEPHSFAGVYLGGKKTFLIRDAELVKNILVKDFACFRDRGIKRDPHDILSRNLFMMRGDDWKNLRIKLTSTFTSGKMKMMFPLVDECGSRLHEKMQKITDTDILIKDVCSRFTTDVIGSCAFGLEINSLDDPDSEFRKIGNRILDSSFTPVFRSIMRNMLPAVAKLSKHLHTDTTVQDFFVDLVQKTVKYREDNKIKRGDFLDLLINLKNDTSSQKSNDQQVQEDLTKFLDQLGENHVKSNIGKSSFTFIQPLNSSHSPSSHDLRVNDRSMLCILHRRFRDILEHPELHVTRTIPTSRYPTKSSSRNHHRIAKARQSVKLRYVEGTQILRFGYRGNPAKIPNHR